MSFTVVFSVMLWPDSGKPIIIITLAKGTELSFFYLPKSILTPCLNVMQNGVLCESIQCTEEEKDVRPDRHQDRATSSMTAKANSSGTSNRGSSVIFCRLKTF